MKRLLYALVPILLSLSLLPFLACSPAASPSTTPSSITITDQLGRTVSLEKLPQRIISIAPANTEILYALGLADRVVAVTDYCNYPPEAKEKPSIGSFSSPNLEEIVAMSPDLVIAAPIHEKQVIPQLESRGINVLALTPKTLDEVMAAISLVGQATGAEQQASTLVDSMQQRIKSITDITDTLTPDQRPEVLYIVWHDPFKASGLATFHDELIKKAGGVNMITDLEGYPNISLETVVQDNPDIMIAGVGMGSGLDAPFIFAREEPRLRDTNARINNRIYSVDSDTAGRAGPRIIDVLEEFARLIHPELFK